MNNADKMELIVLAMTTLYVATWMCLAGWASVSLGDAVRAWTKSRRGARATTVVAFPILALVGAVAIQAVML